MLPPVLEIYVVWHPRDGAGQEIAEEFVQHFHGTVFSGLIGGAVEVYVRSTGWKSNDDAPRPIPSSGSALPADIRQAQFVAVVPILGLELAAAVEARETPWRNYVEGLVEANKSDGNRSGVFPYLLDPRATDGTVLGQILGSYEQIAATPPARDGETAQSRRSRDLAQGIAQMLSRTGDRLTVFISHTKRNSPEEDESVDELIAKVRDVIKNTHLDEFFDASDLQPGQNWDAELRAKAATSALLAVRTDLYTSRDWCQREVLIAKREGMPVIIMDALGKGEERGSFLMDHVPRVPTRMSGGKWRDTDIRHALNLLVDECLKRELWQRQSELAVKELQLNIAWWAPHAPEPITLAKWLEDQRGKGVLSSGENYLLILHPDPPLGAEEKSVLEEIVLLGGIDRKLDIMTPRLLAARGA